MTITQLKYTLAVAEHGNFTTASDKCFVTQPTLSMQVQKLEEELGVVIFNRSTKPLQVTEIGQKVLSQAKKIVEESSRMNDVISEEKGIIGGTLKVGIIPTVSSTLLPLFLNIFFCSWQDENRIAIINNLNIDFICFYFLDYILANV